jgi:hypothetical protein
MRLFNWFMQLLSAMKRSATLCCFICLENICYCPFSSLLSFQVVSSMCAIKYFNIYELRLLQKRGYEIQTCPQHSVRTWQSHLNLQRRDKKTTVIPNKSRYQKNSWVLWEKHTFHYDQKNQNMRAEQESREKLSTSSKKEYDVWKYQSACRQFQQIQFIIFTLQRQQYPLLQTFCL